MLAAKLSKKSKPWKTFKSTKKSKPGKKLKSSKKSKPGKKLKSKLKSKPTNKEFSAWRYTEAKNEVEVEGETEVEGRLAIHRRHIEEEKEEEKDEEGSDSYLLEFDGWNSSTDGKSSKRGERAGSLYFEDNSSRMSEGEEILIISPRMWVQDNSPPLPDLFFTPPTPFVDSVCTHFNCRSDYSDCGLTKCV